MIFLMFLLRISERERERETGTETQRERIGQALPCGSHLRIKEYQTQGKDLHVDLGLSGFGSHPHP